MELFSIRIQRTFQLVSTHSRLRPFAGVDMFASEIKIVDCVVSLKITIVEN